MSIHNYKKSIASLFNKTCRALGLRILLTTYTLALITGCATAGSNQAEQQNKLTDANIAAIVVGANNIDISAGKIALERSTNMDINNFAQRMITDHTAILNSAVALVTKLGVTPVNNDLVAVLTKQSIDHEAHLRTLSGATFDKSYIDHEVSYHQAVIKVVENQLIPSAKNKQLRDTLISVLPGFKAHLKHSQMIQKKF